MANRSSVNALVKIFIALAKLKKPIIRKLLRLKKMRLLEQYSYYGYMKEHESSPSFKFRRMSRNGLKKLYSNLLSICRCFMVGRKMEMYRLDIALDSLAGVEESEGERMVELPNSWGEEDSVDERAERFIQCFYQEMRRERDESNFQLLRGV